MRTCGGRPGKGQLHVAEAVLRERELDGLPSWITLAHVDVCGLGGAKVADVDVAVTRPVGWVLQHLGVAELDD